MNDVRLSSARALPGAVLLACLAALTSCGGGEKPPPAADIDRAYIGAWCEALQVFRHDILDAESQATPYAARNIAANEHFIAAMHEMAPPEDTIAWHEEWTAAVEENLEKLKADDPSAMPDPMDVGPDEALPTRLVDLFSTLPECLAIADVTQEPAPTATSGPGGTNSHGNASAELTGPGEVTVSFDYTYAADPPGKTITDITVTPLGDDGGQLPGSAPVSIPVERGSRHADVTLPVDEARLDAIAGFSICFTGPGEPDLGCLRLDWRAP